MSRKEQIVQYAQSFEGKGMENEELKEVIKLAIIDGALWADAHPKVEVPEKYKTPDWLYKELEQEPEVLPGTEELANLVAGRDFVPVEWVDTLDTYGKWKIVKVEQEVDLEKELTRFYLKDLCGSIKDEIPEATLHHNFPIMWDDLRDIARHFYELGKNSK